MPDEVGISEAANALSAVRDMLDAESVIAFFETPSGDVAMIADEDGVGVAAHGQMVAVTP